MSLLRLFVAVVILRIVSPSVATVDGTLKDRTPCTEKLNGKESILLRTEGK